MGICDTVFLQKLLTAFFLVGPDDIVTHIHIHTHTHNNFTALFDFVQDYPGEPAPER